MSESSLSTGGGSLRAHSHRAPTSDAGPTVTESVFDTALPPMTSQNSSPSTRRPGRSQTSVIVRNPRPQFYNAQESMSSIVARNPQMHRRNGSTLKTVMRRIFSRKSRSHSNESDDSTGESPSGTSQPRPSDTGSEADSFVALSNSLNSKRKTPSPEEEKFPALTSDALEMLSPMPPPRRRATLPSLILSDDALESTDHTEKAKLDQLSPGILSAQEELRRHNLLRTKRCSRSATSLRRLADAHHMSPIQWRRRSADCWGPSAPYRAASESELSVRPTSRKTFDSVARESVASLTSSSSATPSFTPSAAPSESHYEDDAEVEQQTEVESIPPNIGQLITSMQQDDSLSLEQRLATLEVKLIDLEFAIARMQDQRSPTPTDKSKRKKAPTPDTAQQHTRKKSSSHPPARQREKSISQPASAPERPLSTATIRPSTLHRAQTIQTPSSTSLTEVSGITIDQYSALVMLLRREQSARRNLETQVSNLQEDMQYLVKMATNSMQTGTRYPIPSADSHDLLRFRRNMDRPQSDTPIGMDNKIPSPYDSDSDCDGTKEDVFCRPKWSRNNRIEITGMI